MGKRSDFPRRERDTYDTPIEAVLPLLPYLPVDRFNFCEPCAGSGELMFHILGLTAPRSACWHSSDIAPRRDEIEAKDALALSDDDVFNCDFIITNPPWDRKILHPMIVHFSAMRPTWLLFDADWIHTKQAVPYLPWLRKIVSVGRVKWIPDSKMTGKDNCAWYLFDQSSEGQAVFYGRAA